MVKKSLFPWVGLVFFSSLLGASSPVPELRRRVTDLTGTLSVSLQSELENALREFEEKKGAQVVVLVVPTTHPDPIENYSLRVVDQWKLGRKGVDDGVLFLIAKDDRALRIEVGYGLEGALPDVTANRIIEDFVVPLFRSGNFDGGVREGVSRILRSLQGEPLPPPPQRSQGSGHGVVLLFFFIFFGWMILSRLIFGRSSYGFRRGGWSSGGGSWGGGGGGGGGFSGGGGGFGGGGASGRW